MTISRESILISAISLAALFIFYFNYNSQAAVSLNEIYKSDYPNYYFAGKRWLAGEDIYKPIANDVEKYFGWKKYIAYTADTPLTVVLLSPLSYLDIQDGALLLNIISVLLLCCSVFFLTRNYGYSILTAVFFTSLALSSFPFIFLLKKCHMESLVLFAGISGIIFLRKSYYKSCGLCWGFAAALKIFPLFWLLPFLFTKDKRKVFYTGLLSFLFLSALSVMLVGYNNTAVYIQEIIPKSKMWYGTVGNYSIISFFTALFGYETAKLYALVCAFIIFISFIYFISRKNISDEKSYALSTSTALLLSPLSWLNYFILIFPALIFLSKKYSYYTLINYFSLLVLFTIFWCWPEYIGTPWQSLTICLSFMPMFALVSIFYHFQKKL